MADRIVVMNRGVIEQQGTPGEIYGEPVNPFVADFIGQMNFLPGIVVDAERVRLGTLDLHHRGRVQGLRPGAAVTLCVRPEDVVVQPEAAADAGSNAFAARVPTLTSSVASSAPVWLPIASTA